MLRWLLLLATFLVWVASIALIYSYYGPREVREAMPGTQANLEALFMENAEPVRAWNIFLDPRSLKDGNNTAAKKWDGVNEETLSRVGWMETTLKRKDFTRVEQVTEFALAFPSELNVPMLQMLGEITYRSRSDISMDQGLETFSSRFTLGLGLDVRSIGFRQNDELVVTQQVWDKEKELFSQRDHIAAGERGTPSLELMPFSHNPNIRVGSEWSIALLDTSIDMSAAARPKILAYTAKCTGTRQIKHQDDMVLALEVTANDGKARAWYTADGVVVKQSFKIADMLEVMVVREEFRTHQKNRLRQNNASRKK